MNIEQKKQHLIKNNPFFKKIDSIKKTINKVQEELLQDNDLLQHIANLYLNVSVLDKKIKPLYDISKKLLPDLDNNTKNSYVSFNDKIFKSLSSEKKEELKIYLEKLDNNTAKIVSNEFYDYEFQEPLKETYFGFSYQSEEDLKQIKNDFDNIMPGLADMDRHTHSRHQPMSLYLSNLKKLGFELVSKTEKKSISKDDKHSQYGYLLFHPFGVVLQCDDYHSIDGRSVNSGKMSFLSYPGLFEATEVLERINSYDRHTKSSRFGNRNTATTLDFGTVHKYELDAKSTYDVLNFFTRNYLKNNLFDKAPLHFQQYGNNYGFLTAELTKTEYTPSESDKYTYTNKFFNDGFELIKEYLSIPETQTEMTKDTESINDIHQNKKSTKQNKSDYFRQVYLLVADNYTGNWSNTEKELQFQLMTLIFENLNLFVEEKNKLKLKKILGDNPTFETFLQNYNDIKENGYISLFKLSSYIKENKIQHKENILPNPENILLNKNNLLSFNMVKFNEPDKELMKLCLRIVTEDNFEPLLNNNIIYNKTQYNINIFQILVYEPNKFFAVAKHFIHNGKEELLKQFITQPMLNRAYSTAIIHLSDKKEYLDDFLNLLDLFHKDELLSINHIDEQYASSQIQLNMLDFQPQTEVEKMIKNQYLFGRKIITCQKLLPKILVTLLNHMRFEEQETINKNIEKITHFLDKKGFTKEILTKEPFNFNLESPIVQNFFYSFDIKENKQILENELPAKKGKSKIQL